MLGIEWSPEARQRLREIRDYIALDKPEAAERLAMRIAAVVEALRSHPHLGRVGAAPGVRELVIGGTPYVVVYRPRRSSVRILTIWHAAQRRKS